MEVWNCNDGCSPPYTETRSCSSGSAGVALCSAGTINSGSGKISQIGVDLGYHRAGYLSAISTTAVGYNNLMTTVLKTAGINSFDQLNGYLAASSNVYPSIGPPTTLPPLNVGANYYRFWAVSSTDPATPGSLENILNTIISRNETTAVQVIVPFSQTMLASTSLTTAKTIPSGLRMIVFVNGSLTVNADIKTTNTDSVSSIVFVLNNAGALDVGNLTVTANVGSLDGVYIFPGAFNDGDDTASPKQLVGHGSLLSIGQTTGTPSDLGAGFVRKYDGGPSESWIYEPKYLTVYRTILATPSYTWSELVPTP
jgi:hypothetical protein